MAEIYLGSVCLVWVWSGFAKGQLADAGPFVHRSSPGPRHDGAVRIGSTSRSSWSLVAPCQRPVGAAGWSKTAQKRPASPWRSTGRLVGGWVGIWYTQTARTGRSNQVVSLWAAMPKSIKNNLTMVSEPH